MRMLLSGETGFFRRLWIILVVTAAAALVCLAGMGLWLRTQKPDARSIYQKLADGARVNVLVVGDSIAEGTGASSEDCRWVSLLARDLRATYGSRVKLTNVSMGGNTSYAGYVRTLALDDRTSYDLVILCYGQNDAEEDFGLYYEALIRAARDRCPHASLIAILESPQREMTPKMQTIQALAAHYGIPVVDAITPFQADYEALVVDGTHPNDAGHALYAESVMEVIRPLVAARRGFDPEKVVPVNEEVAVFDTFTWLSAGQFERRGNTFTLNLPEAVTGTVLGIDLANVEGHNRCTVVFDEESVATREFNWDFGFTQRHIDILNDWRKDPLLEARQQIRVVFDGDDAGKAQADSFRGLAISGW